MKMESGPISGGDARLSEEEKQRNEALLAEYEYDKYSEALTGYTGMNLQEIAVWQRYRAVRTRIGPRGNYKSGLTALPDGTLIASPCRATSQPGIMQIHVYASKDSGLTWEEIGQQVPLGKEPTLVCLPDGSMLMMGQILGGEEVDKTQMPISRSTDGGRTWQTSPIDGPDFPRNIIVEPDGSVLFVRAKMCGYYKVTYEQAGKPFEPNSNLELLRSKDGGLNWERSEGVIDWDYDKYSEVSCVRLPNGNLLASLRGNPPGTEREAFEITWLTESSDDGKTWSKPRVMSNIAEVHVHLLVLNDGRLLATYSNYHLPFGAYAVLSSDNGKTWSYDRPIQLAISADFYVGWPVSLQLNDGSIITVYAITAYLNQPPDRYTCEAVRWNLPGDV